MDERSNSRSLGHRPAGQMPSLRSVFWNSVLIKLTHLHAVVQSSETLELNPVSRVTAIQSPAPPSGRSAGCVVCRNPSVSASPPGRWRRASSLWSSPGSAVYCCPLASSGRGSLLSCWSRSVCPWRSSGGPESPGLFLLLLRGQRLASHRWPGGSESWGTRSASAPGDERTGQSKVGSRESRSDLQAEKTLGFQDLTDKLSGQFQKPVTNNQTLTCGAVLEDQAFKCRNVRGLGDDLSVVRYGSGHRVTDHNNQLHVPGHGADPLWCFHRDKVPRRLLHHNLSVQSFGHHVPDQTWRHSEVWVQDHAAKKQTQVLYNRSSHCGAVIGSYQDGRVLKWICTGSGHQ